MKTTRELINEAKHCIDFDPAPPIEFVRQLMERLEEYEREHGEIGDDPEDHMLSAAVSDELMRLRKFKAMTHTWLDERGAPKFNDQDCRLAARLKWMADNRLLLPSGLPAHEAQG